MTLLGHLVGLVMAIGVVGSVRTALDYMEAPYWASFTSGVVAAMIVLLATYKWRERKFPKDSQ